MNALGAPIVIVGRRASAIAASVETGIREGRIPPGALLPTVRELAAALTVSPATVASAYRALRNRGILSSQGRRGTRISARPPLLVPSVPVIPSGLRNLADGNPDPALLPPLGAALAQVDRRSRLYGGPGKRADLVKLAQAQLAADGVSSGALAVVGGALDGIERVLQAHLRPGDRVAVEDPGHIGVLDLVASLGLVVEPMAIDDTGPLPEQLALALAAGAHAAIVTPRAQNPTGASLDEKRARALHKVLEAHPDVLVIEDDHAGPVAGAPALTLSQRRQRWAVVRSISKSLGPDLRLAVVAGDPLTVARVEGRQLVGSGWVSHVLQRIVAALWSDASTAKRLRAAAAVYAARRNALIEALAVHGFPSHGRSGLNVWVPVAEEAAAVSALAAAGWAVRAGERFRIKSPPAIRITVSTLSPPEARRLAATLAANLTPGARTALT